jgi:peptidoglycan hydrolase CwlO-like protein
MPRITVTVDEHHEQTLSDVNPENQAEAVRTCIEEYGRVHQLEDELQQRDARVDELRSKLQEANSRIDASNEIVEYVESEMDTQDRRERRRQANILRRAWWKLAGVPSDEDTGN